MLIPSAPDPGDDAVGDYAFSIQKAGFARIPAGGNPECHAGGKRAGQQQDGAHYQSLA